MEKVETIEERMKTNVERCRIRQLLGESVQGY